MEIKQISKKKASIINLLFNYANALFAIINGLVLVPLYLTYFSVGTYGSFLSSGNIVTMLGLIEGGMSFVLTQKLSSSYAKRDFKAFSNLLGSGLFISVTISLILIFVGIALFPFVSDWVKAEPNEYRNIQFAFLLSSIGAGLNIIYYNISGVFQALLKVRIGGFTNLVSIFFGVLSTLLGLKLGLGVVSIPLGILIRSSVGVIILAIVLISIINKEHSLKINITKKDCNNLIKATMPILGGGIAKSLVTNSQLIIITNFINPTASAIFFITGRIYQVCDSFLAPVGSSIFSSMSQIYGEGDKEKIKKNLIGIFLLFNAFSALILSSSFVINSSFVKLLLGQDKFGGMTLSALLAISMLFYTRFNFLSINLFALGVFGKTVLYDMIAGLVRVILIFSLISYLGFIAMPIAEILSTTLLLGYFLNKLVINKLDLNNNESIKFIFSGSIILIIIIICSIVLVFYLPKPNDWAAFVGISLLLAIINTVIVLLFSEGIREIFYNILQNLKIKKRS